MIKQYGIFHSHASFVFVQVYEEESIATENGATPEPRPFFEDPDSNITVQLAAPVHLHCRVENLQERTVSTVCIETFREFDRISRSKNGFSRHPLREPKDLYWIDSIYVLVFNWWLILF